MLRFDGGLPLIAWDDGIGNLLCVLVLASQELHADILIGRGQLILPPRVDSGANTVTFRVQVLHPNISKRWQLREWLHQWLDRRWRVAAAGDGFEVELAPAQFRVTPPTPATPAPPADLPADKTRDR